MNREVEAKRDAEERELPWRNRAHLLSLICKLQTSRRPRV
jgi:hypothetical protein